MQNYRSRKASITTGVVERTEALKNEALDRLSPLSSSVNTFTSFPEINDSNNELNNDLEKFVDMDIDTQQQVLTPEFNSPAVTYSHLGANVTNGSTRRHTVGPGDVEHEQALANPSAVPINFKFGTDNAPRLPVNLPMMQNQPLHNFTMKNQHLLKLPTVMEASKCANSIHSSNFKLKKKKRWTLSIMHSFCNRFVWSTSFGRWRKFAILLYNIGEQWAIGGADLCESSQCTGSSDRRRFNATAA